MTKREWQIEMANRFAKRDNDIEELDTRSYLIGRYDSTKTLTDEEISAVWASKNMMVNTLLTTLILLETY